jgi:hypothetical protein
MPYKSKTNLRKNSNKSKRKRRKAEVGAGPNLQKKNLVKKDMKNKLIKTFIRLRKKHTSNIIEDTGIVINNGEFISKILISKETPLKYYIYSENTSLEERISENPDYDTTTNIEIWNSLHKEINDTQYRYTFLSSKFDKYILTKDDNDRRLLIARESKNKNIKRIKYWWSLQKN